MKMPLHFFGALALGAALLLPPTAGVQAAAQAVDPALATALET